jgi:hypothetical protein
VVEFRANRPVDDPVASMVILDGSGDFVFRTGTADLRLGRMDGTFRVTWDMEAVPLPEGRYFLTIGIHDRAERIVYDWHDQRYGFDVSQSMEADTRMFIPIQTRIDRQGTAATVGDRDGE